MAKVKISEYSATPSANTDVDNIDINEGCSPSGINNAIRAVMSHLKNFQTGASGDSVTVGGNLSVTGTTSLSGTATAPTVSTADNSTNIATTAFVSSKVGTIGTMAAQNAASVAITGGTINGATVGVTTAAAGVHTTFSTTGATSFNALTTAGETTTISATAATGTINYDVSTQSVVYYTSNATANWTLNVRGSSTVTLNTLMAVGETRTITFLVTQGTTAFYQSALQIDGASVTPRWQGGSAPTSGNVSGIDIYVLSIIKTGSAAFTVLASQTQFK